MSDLAAVRRRNINAMEVSVKTIGNIIENLTQDQATSYRDGEDGWTLLEILCHVRDFNEIFYERAKLIASRDTPTFKMYDHEAMVIDGEYNRQNITEVYIQLVRSRREFIGFFQELSEAQWQRHGIHPEHGRFSMIDSMVQVVTHELDHIEQMTRVIANA